MRLYEKMFALDDYFMLILLSESFRKLGDLISEFPELVKSSKFLFVPGPHDTGPSTILPRYVCIVYTSNIKEASIILIVVAIHNIASIL